MGFVIKKLLWLLLPPLNLTMLLVFGGLGLRPYYERAGGLMFRTGVALFIICGILPTGQIMLGVLESQYSQPALPRQVDGILVLGGAFDVNISKARNMPTLYGSAERVTETLHLMHLYPGARVIYSGGNGTLEQDAPSEADVFQSFLQRIGVSAAQVQWETRSRDTDENIRYSLPLAKAGPHATWIVVTSAAHMKRTLALMRHYRWPGTIIPYPVDYQTTSDDLNLTPNPDIFGNFSAMHAAAREWIGLIAYRISGRIDAF